MNITDWKLLEEGERKEKCKVLNPYEEWDLFKAVESDFISEFENQPGIEKANCGIDPSMGPYNSIVVTIKRGQARTKLPKQFLGFPVLKEYQKK